MGVAGRSGPALLALLWAAPASAWSNHALLTWMALAPEPPVAHATPDSVAHAAPVSAETLEHFLAENESGVGSLLDAMEEEARRTVPAYPPRPDELRYAGGASGRSARRRFVEAIRINPTVPLALFVQVVPGQARRPGRAAIAERELVPEGAIAGVPRVFEALLPGEGAAPIEVVSTASDEPDYGMDVGLFEDNGTPFGARYGWGRQSVGNPRLSFGSQAPFHMGFFHEPAIVYSLAGFLRRMYPEQRIDLYLALSRYAFATRHDYWGWRFLGWALHYIQDLAQPYHATAMPHKSTAGALWNNVLARVGITGPQERMVTFATNRHLALEDFQLRLLGAILQRPREPGGSGVVAPALADRQADASLPAWDRRAPRDLVSARAHALAAATDEAICASVPARYVADPSYTWSVTEPAPDLLEVLRQQPAAQARLERALADALRSVGKWTRRAVEYASPAASKGRATGDRD